MHGILFYENGYNIPCDEEMVLDLYLYHEIQHSEGVTQLVPHAQRSIEE